MDKSVFDYSDYKKYLVQLSDSQPRGFRKALAEAAGCQTAYVSHVLNGPGHFNLEQAEATARFAGLTRDEVRYFLVLVEFNRAGTKPLKRVLEEQLQEMREQFLKLGERVSIKATLTREDQATYYSSWHYAAVHMAATVPGLQTRDALKRSLRIPSRKLAAVLEFLLSAGLLRKEGDRLLPGSTLLHLEKDSPLIFQHHANWRERALASMHEDESDSSVHYSSVITLSREDAQRLRTLISQNLGEWIEIVKPSKEEQVYGLNLDFFRVDRD